MFRWLQFIAGTPALDKLSLNTDEFSDSRSWKDAIEMTAIGTEDRVLRHPQEHCEEKDTIALKRLDHIMNRIIMSANCKCVEDYIQTSPEADVLLYGIDEEGNSALNLAACRKYPAITKLLLDHGADVDHQNKNGRSPLMEAALWGRIDNVKSLLEHNANRNLRDINGRRAIEFTEQSPRNDEEHYERSGGESQIYHEILFTANQARRVIFELLKNPNDCQNKVVPKQDQGFQAYSFKRIDGRTVELVAPIAEFPVSTPWKTIASLQRPPNYPLIAAISGWSHGDGNVVVSKKDWTDEVRRISQTVGHQLQIHQHDQGVEGQFFASHAEKQLVAYFISKHVFIDCEEQELLQRAKPPVFLDQATILVSRSPCDDCLKFVRAVNTSLGLIISILDRFEG